jgi:hypothetical protein
MYVSFRNHLYNWLFQLHGPEAGVIVLVQRRVFILPTGHGVIFAAILVLMLTGSINYNLSLGFVLTFLLAALQVNAMIYTFRNLANLRVSGGRTRPVYAGDTARFAVNLENRGEVERYSIGLTHDKKASEFVDLPARATASVQAGIPAARRGVLRPGRLTLFTRYPLGLYYAWAYLELDMHCIVYPRPAAPGLPLPVATSSAGEGNERGEGQEDFAGLRQYHRGDSPRHVAWKVAARDQGCSPSSSRAGPIPSCGLPGTSCRARSASRRSCHISRAGCSTPTPPACLSACASPGKWSRSPPETCNGTGASRRSLYSNSRQGLGARGSGPGSAEDQRHHAMALCALVPSPNPQSLL